MAEHNTHRTPTPTCPHCGYAMTHEDMITSEHDLFGLAPLEDEATLQCPGCDLEYVVQGGYRPHYTSVFCEEQLLDTEGD